ncbi:MAG: hypothetical protein ACRC1K_08190, partial [Planctomycetia bacterium]
KQTAAADTVEMQRRIITDLETLLKPRQSKKPKDDKDEKEKKQREKTSGKPQKEEQQQSLQQQIVQQRGEQPSRDSRDDGARLGTARKEELKQMLEVKDVWGHLGAIAREQASQFAKDSFLPKYRLMLEQYYTTIADKSRGGDER